MVVEDHLFDRLQNNESFQWCNQSLLLPGSQLIESRKKCINICTPYPQNAPSVTKLVVYRRARQPGGGEDPHVLT